MHPIGFSTGALALGDFRRGLTACARASLQAVELSALRPHELEPLVSALPSLDLSSFSYVSLHAPSTPMAGEHPDEAAVELLLSAAQRGWNIIVHPDAIGSFAPWRKLADSLCIENMDKRKPIGRTAEELQTILSRLPDARLCFDIAHARQVDPTMCRAAEIIRRFHSRIAQVHISEVDTQSRHRPLSLASSLAYQRVLGKLENESLPFIIESVIQESEMADEVRAVRACIESSLGRTLLIAD